MPYCNFAGGIFLEEKISNLTRDTIVKALEKVLKENKKRNFTQAVDAGINLQGINFKQPQNRIDLIINLPNPFRKGAKVVLFAKDSNIINLFKGSVDKVISAEEIPALAKKDAKKLARDYDLFFAESTVMALIGKHLGQILAPRGKMPKPCPPAPQALKVLVENATKSVLISNKKGKNLPTLHFMFGKEDMQIDKVADNFMACYTRLVDALPGKTQNIKSLYVKTTMGKPEFIYRKM